MWPFSIQLAEIWNQTEKTVLPAAALILSVVNGAILLRNYLRDKAKLIVTPVHPEIYQVWIRLRDVVADDGRAFRRYAFISYFGVANCGVRDVAVDGWRLHIRNRLRIVNRWHKSKELKPYNLPEPQCLLGEHIKLIPAFGQRTQNFPNNENMVRSGDSISGIACWMYSVWGGEGWSPKTDKNNNITATLKIKSVFGKKSKCRLVFREFTIERLKKMMPTVGEYLESSDDFLI
ncbi:MAG: hypothetical protein SFW64_02370 [Alphaproteobacteria bacterium]|nr:hypothetical protein [Alphaproteobacteria bacterium]